MKIRHPRPDGVPADEWRRAQQQAHRSINQDLAAAYGRKWRAQNPAYGRNWWAKNSSRYRTPPFARAQPSLSDEEKKERSRARNRAYRAANRESERVRKAERDRQRNGQRSVYMRAYYIANRARFQAHARAWHKRNRTWVREYVADRRNALKPSTLVRIEQLIKSKKKSK